jgi:DNA-directed RNA polymerase specialized sigma24 family protein
MLDSAGQFLTTKPEDVQKIFYLMYDVGLSISEIAQALS